MIRIFLKWLPFAAVTTCMCLLVYGAVQQNFRQSLNDPQIQMAEDIAVPWDAGSVDPTSLLPKEHIDIANSLAAWVVLYSDFNNQLKPQAGSGFLHDKLPNIPLGVFEYARNQSNLQHRVTWQPEPDIRQALVIIAIPRFDYTQYVVAGRNMREVELREENLGHQVFIAWIVTLLASLVAVWIGVRLRRAKLTNRT